MRKVRCANGQIIKSPMIGMNKTQTSIRHGIGTQPLSADGSPDHVEESIDEIKSKSPIIKSPTGSIISKGVRRNKEGMNAIEFSQNIY